MSTLAERAAKARYRRTKKGKAAERRYAQTAKRKAVCKRYAQSKRGKRLRRLWRHGVRGRFNIAKGSAKIRGIAWNLSFEEYSKLVSCKCTYCGGALPSCGGGLDRLDRRKSYIIGNVAPCCSACNKKKGYLEFAGFVYPRIISLMRELSR